MSVKMKVIVCLGVCLLVSTGTEAATYGQKIVAAVLMAEAWGEGEVGMTAVAEVIRNRASEAQTSPLAVVTSSRQFSCLNNTSPEKLYNRFCRFPAYSKALEISRRMYNSPHELPGYARGANHFTRSVEKPFWARGKRPVVVIGNHTFYRL
jgi:spore germination cell wall hydrolase CwlJ-like protein